MLPVKRYAIPLVALAMTSACGQPERPRTVSDFCLSDRKLTIEPAPAVGVDDPGNQWDSEQTVADVLEHNAVHQRLCP